MSTTESVQRPHCFEPSLDITFPGVSAVPDDVVAAANYISCQPSGGDMGRRRQGHAIRSSSNVAGVGDRISNIRTKGAKPYFGPGQGRSLDLYALVRETDG
jgi:hypothetical protein